MIKTWAIVGAEVDLGELLCLRELWNRVAISPASSAYWDEMEELRATIIYNSWLLGVEV